MDELGEMSGLLQQAADLLRQAVDVGSRMRGRSPEVRQAVDREWERFLAEFLRELKHKGRERGENLLAGISFTRILGQMR